MDFFNTLQVVLEVNCGELLQHVLVISIIECGEFHQELGLRKLNSEFLQHILRNFDGRLRLILSRA